MSGTKTDNDVYSWSAELAPTECGGCDRCRTAPHYEEDEYLPHAAPRRSICCSATLGQQER
jgi:hypothetical protein